MRTWIACAVWVVGGAVAAAQSVENNDELLERIRQRMRDNLARLTDYTCQQTVERARRASPKDPFQPLDTLRLEIGVSGGREIFSWQGARRFEERDLAELVRSGTVGNGSFLLHARNVFLSPAPEITFAGKERLGEDETLRYDFEILEAQSRFRVRVGASEAVVGYRGSFWVDAATLDLLRLDVLADDIPERLPLTQVRDRMEYAPTLIGDSMVLLPRTSEFFMTNVAGDETRNRTSFSACRKFGAESVLSFNESAATPADRSAAMLPPGAQLDVTLETEIQPEAAAAGDPVRAVLSRPVREGQNILVPKGTPVLGRIVRVEKQVMPIPHYVVGLELHALETPGGRLEFQATMEDAGPAGGLLREARRMDPTFSRKRAARMDILVREHPAGGGVLHWKADQAPIRRGLPMRWTVDALESAAARRGRP